MNSLLKELSNLRVGWFNRRSAYHQSWIFIIHSFIFLFHFIGAHASLYQLCFITFVGDRRRCCYCQLWSISFRLRLLTRSTRMIFSDHFSIWLLVVPQVTNLLSFILSLVPLRFLDVICLFVHFLSSQRHWCFSRTNIVFSFLMEFHGSSDPR